MLNIISCAYWPSGAPIIRINYIQECHRVLRVKITEKSPMLLTGSRESSQHGLNSEHPVLLNNSPPQGKLFCKSQIHLGFYQSLTNLRERKYSFPAPYSLPILLKGEKFWEALVKVPSHGHRLTKRSRPRYRTSARWQKEALDPPFLQEHTNSTTIHRQISFMENPDERLMHTRQAWNQIHWNGRQI